MPITETLETILAPREVTPPVGLPFLSVARTIITIPESGEVVNTKCLTVTTATPAAVSTPDSPKLSILVFDPILAPKPAGVNTLPMAGAATLRVIQTENNAAMTDATPSDTSNSEYVESDALYDLVTCSSTISLLLMSEQCLSAVMSPSVGPVAVLMLPASVTEVVTTPSFSWLGYFLLVFADHAVAKLDAAFATGSAAGFDPAGPIVVGVGTLTPPTFYGVRSGGGGQRPDEGVPMFAAKRAATTRAAPTCLYFLLDAQCADPSGTPTGVPLDVAIGVIPGVLVLEGDTMSN